MLGSAPAWLTDVMSEESAAETFLSAERNDVWRVRERLCVCLWWADGPQRGQRVGEGFADVSDQMRAAEYGRKSLDRHI